MAGGSAWATTEDIWGSWEHELSPVGRRKMAKLSSHFHRLYGAVQGGGDFHSESNTEKVFKAKAYGKSNAVLRTNA